MKSSHRRRVLHSMPAPDNDTRYATHMASLDGPEFEMSFFTWRRALLGQYDIFHLHWPEQLLARTSGVMGKIRLIRARALLFRLRRRQTPVVYTLHNHAPSEDTVSPEFFKFYSGIVGLASLEIHLVPEPERASSVETMMIPHGSYREPFASLARETPMPGHLLFFGILKAYKGVERLLAEFTVLDDPNVRLRIVGEAKLAETVAAIDETVLKDSRVSSRYGFVPDRDLVVEISAAGLVVLPYTEFHSSAAALVALSLDRPILIPSSPTADALREEVGAPWVHIFTPPLTASALQQAMRDPAPAGRPNLDGRAWDIVRQAHTVAYRKVVDRAQS